MTTHLPFLTTRIRQDNADDESILARQWRLLKLLVFAPNGFTIKELVAFSGTSEWTVKRDLAVLKQVGFDLAETVEDSGRKSFRIRHLSEPAEGVDARQEQYCLIHDVLRQLHDVALILGDSLLAADLEGMQLRVLRKCGKEKPR